MPSPIAVADQSHRLAACDLRKACLVSVIQGRRETDRSLPDRLVPLAPGVLAGNPVPTPSTLSARGRALLDAARAGDDQAYRQLVEPHRRELHALCYRMLGSRHDADDALQVALFQAWRGLPGFEGRSSVRSWLFTIATNASLKLIARRPKRVLPIDIAVPADLVYAPDQPLAESAWVEPYPDELLGLADGIAAPERRYELRESVELAFIAALQHLPANQRAALILREVLGFSAGEAADMLKTTVASVNGALRRARKAVDERLPEESQQATVRSLGDRRLRELVDAYVDAMERADVPAVVAMLSEDATWSMPPLPTWYAGHDAIAAFLAREPLSGRYRWRRTATWANGQPAVAGYIWDPDAGGYGLQVLDVLTLEGARISAITAFHASDPGADFGVPARLSGE
jgi:RNA polymerase sigma-70 factor, ECF subfamily